MEDHLRQYGHKHFQQVSAKTDLISLFFLPNNTHQSFTLLQNLGDTKLEFTLLWKLRAQARVHAMVQVMVQCRAQGRVQSRVRKS